MMFVICSTSKTRPTLFWTGHGWTDAVRFAKTFVSIIDAMSETQAWKDRGHKADTVAKL